MRWPNRVTGFAVRAVAALLACGVVGAGCSGSAAERLTEPATAPTSRPGTEPPGTEPPGTEPPGTEPPGTELPSTRPTTVPVAPPVSPLGETWQAGDCFDFGRSNGLEALPYAPYGDDQRAPCDGPHTHDVYHADRLPEGSDDPFPADLDDRVDAACSKEFLDAFRLMWPDSTYSLIRYLPDEQEWADGERYLACVAYRAEPGGLVERRTSPAGGIDAVWPAEPGNCFTGDLPSVRQPAAVDCAAPHTFQVVAVGAHPALGGDAFPSQSQLDGFMDQFCLDELDRFAGRGAGAASVVPVRFGRSEWDLGYRRIRCLAFATVEGGLALVHGSFDGEWDVIGPAGGDVVTALGGAATS